MKLWGVAAALALTSGCYEGVGDRGEGEDAGEDGAEDGDGDGDGDDDDDSNDDGGNGVDAECAEGIAASEAPLRRMTDVQYRNTVEALFDGLIDPSEAFPETLGSTPYTSYPEANLVTQLGTEGIMMAAEDVAAQAVENLAAVVPCADGGDEDACANEFIQDFGSRAFRRPILPEERALIRGLYDSARAESDFDDAIGRVIAATMQMPQFVYIVEIGEEIEPGIVRLTDYEVASRLSYFFWNTSPDDELLAAAEAGELSSLEDVEAQARRLLADGRADAMVAQFSRQWLQVGTLSVSDKDTTLFPAYDETLVAAMQEELDRFVSTAYRSGAGSLQQLLGSSDTSVNAPLAALYGIDSGSTGPDDWREVTLDDNRRAGVLTLPAVISANSPSTSSSAILRGKMVRTQALCQEMPPPPMELDVPEFPEDATEREKSEILMNDASCGSCHALMNPLGLAFENYDAIGVWHETDESGNPIDASGEVVSGPQGVTGEFDGVPELSQMIASSDNSAACMTTQWMRYVQGRRETPEDACVVEALTTRLVESDFDLQELLVAFTQTDGFRFRRMGAE